MSTNEANANALARQSETASPFKANLPENIDALAREIKAILKDEDVISARFNGELRETQAKFSRDCEDIESRRDAATKDLRIEAGRLLIAAKAKVDPGKWRRWLRENIQRSASDCYQCMKMAGADSPEGEREKEKSSTRARVQKHRDAKRAEKAADAANASVTTPPVTDTPPVGFVPPGPSWSGAATKEPPEGTTVINGEVSVPLPFDDSAASTGATEGAEADGAETETETPSTTTEELPEPPPKAIEPPEKTAPEPPAIPPPVPAILLPKPEPLREKLNAFDDSIADIFPNSLHLDTFRRMVTDPINGQYIRYDQQRQVAEEIIKTAKKYREELTAKFIRRCVGFLVREGSILVKKAADRDAKPNPGQRLGDALDKIDSGRRTMFSGITAAVSEIKAGASIPVKFYLYLNELQSHFDLAIEVLRGASGIIAGSKLIEGDLASDVTATPGTTESDPDHMIEVEQTLEPDPVIEAAPVAPSEPEQVAPVAAVNDSNGGDSAELSEAESKGLRIFKDKAASGGSPYIGILDHIWDEVEDVVEPLIAKGLVIRSEANPNAYRAAP